MALARGFWIGAVPPELACLRYAERLLVARVRHSVCWAKISTGMRKMKTNVICFEVPVPRVYDMLPPPRDDIQEVLAIFFTGPKPPTEEDMKRTPFLVRRNEVRRALEWLILNHCDYADVSISTQNLASYPEDAPPVAVEYVHSTTNKSPENSSVFDKDQEDGTSEGDCLFTVHGITGDKLENMSVKTLKARAFRHLNNRGKFLVVGHESEPLSLWNSPNIYPQMFPWLFPYGLGGVGSVPGTSQKAHKRHLLFYHDKRFQLDPTFCFVAFSHEQMSLAQNQGHLIVDRSQFNDVSSRLLSVDPNVLQNLINRMANGETVRAETEMEKQCWRVFHDLDHIMGKVNGSITNKKYMRNEVWSLVALRGSPSWYITLSPADIQHPLCLYFAGTSEKFYPDILPYDRRLRLICRNPVAAARFFHFLVDLFITEVLGVKARREPGAYGPTSAYYGTVEQQGRLTLHLHMLIWISGSVSPQVIRDRILNDLNWQGKIVEWLEAAHVGEFLTGSLQDVKRNVDEKSESDLYVDPTMVLPVSPPLRGCSVEHADGCSSCSRTRSWWEYFRETVDDLFLKSNTYVNCRDNKFKRCRARFPRELHETTRVDPATGALALKKGEAWINTMTPLLTYIMGCNTDVTSLLSGTAVKAVIVYVTDYITKPGLKTHVVFDAIRTVITRDTNIMWGDIKAKDIARRLMTKIVNLVSAKMELGAPMIALYLMGNPDHYTDHTFVPLYWTSYVNQVKSAFPDEQDRMVGHDKVAVIKQQGRYVQLSCTFDYVYRPSVVESLPVYDFVRCCKRVQVSSVHRDKRTLPRGTFAFGPDHPLADSHGLRVNTKAMEYVVPNLLGGTLPRPGVGSENEYGVAMLALFVPWRSGTDLRAPGEDWSAAWNRTAVSPRYETIMKNINLKYECLDARDDFRAQLKAGAGISLPNSSWFDPDHEFDAPSDDQEASPIGSNHIVDGAYRDGIDAGDELGKCYGDRLATMKRMASILENSGWTLPARIKQNVSLGNDASVPFLLASDWRAQVLRKRQEVLDSRSKAIPPSVKDTPDGRRRLPTNAVFVAGKKYLTKDPLYNPVIQRKIDDVVASFGLNYEQEKVFRIVANHASDDYSERLNMYIGGMGGTGKSQVLKALMEFFKSRGESYRLIVVAPTGSAAALLGGMTYHSAFGINDRSGPGMAAVKSKLLGVDYVFFDEISMVSAYELYRISARLCRNTEHP
ncbi:hypothetical protein CC1G_04133 [Coprinopsis cinerea okayama7|uniref:ATP-dependent DNA helicase n=1 Tax=Coprinopsis cinerea (strain Okayama-7 / 130 / ATCC MYA-4618 / FGSC 9003) TaxID=240176 RepID=A8NW39_COPC7|nr:hypothetical protein CC1G_04133 [Coprinopsis cinerea okayama7\|eukprot:XP_001836820.2 hypothetical protein CC1G_04133 [Coprinopsis cinerea okayama7\